MLKDELLGCRYISDIIKLENKYSHKDIANIIKSDEEVRRKFTNVVGKVADTNISQYPELDEDYATE